MSEHPALTERQREVIAAVVVTGSIKGSVQVLGITESSAHHRVSYARSRCGCASLLELVWRHRLELDGAITVPTAMSRAGGIVAP